MSSGGDEGTLQTTHRKVQVLCGALPQSDSHGPATGPG